MKILTRTLTEFNLTKWNLDWNVLLLCAALDSTSICDKHFDDESGHVSDIYYPVCRLKIANISFNSNSIDEFRWNLSPSSIVHRNKRHYSVLLVEKRRMNGVKQYHPIGISSVLDFVAKSLEIWCNQKTVQFFYCALFSAMHSKLCSQNHENAMQLLYNKNYVHLNPLKTKCDAIVWPFFWQFVHLISDF